MSFEIWTEKCSEVEPPPGTVNGPFQTSEPLPEGSAMAFPSRVLEPAS